MSPSGMRAKLIFPSPPQQAVSTNFDLILVLTTLHGQKARDRCHCGEIDDCTRVGRKYYNFANSEFMAHRWRVISLP